MNALLTAAMLAAGLAVVGCTGYVDGLGGNVSDNASARSDAPSVALSPRVTFTQKSEPNPANPAVPMLDQWEYNMVTFGPFHCAKAADATQPWGARAEEGYYDGEGIAYLIRDYASEVLGAPNDAFWNECARAHEVAYRDEYALPNAGAVAGWDVRVRGLYLDYTLTRDEESKRALALIAHNNAFAHITSDPYLISIAGSREAAYSLESKLLARDLGEAGLDEEIAFLTDVIFGHFKSWFVRRDAEYVRPFMVGLSAEALILLYQKTGDPRVLAVLQRAADELWKTCWLPDQQTFMYTDRVHPSGDQSPAPDLNLMIAPLYAWVYLRTGDVGYREKADAIWVGGVTNQAHEEIPWGVMSYPKQFNQAYRMGFDFLRYRDEGTPGVPRP
jgi:hypothetical protein